MRKKEQRDMEVYKAREINLLSKFDQICFQLLCNFSNTEITDNLALTPRYIYSEQDSWQSKSLQCRARYVALINEIWLISAALRYKVKKKHDRKFISTLKCQLHLYIFIWIRRPAVDKDCSITHVIQNCWGISSLTGWFEKLF